MTQIRQPRKGGSDYLDQLVEAGERVHEATKLEVRYFLAKRLREMGRADEAGVAEIESCGLPAGVQVDASFLAGMRFAAELVGDADFDY